MASALREGIVLGGRRRGKPGLTLEDRGESQSGASGSMLFVTSPPEDTDSPYPRLVAQGPLTRRGTVNQSDGGYSATFCMF